MKKILVTGCSGFIGHHLIKKAQDAGFFVKGVDKRPIPSNHYKPNLFVQADVKDLNYRDMMGIDYVIHLAWRTNIPDCIRHPEESTNQNIDMSLHMLELAREAGIKKMLFPSTASLYGNNSTPWHEDLIPDPIEHYSWQKLSIEYACQMYSKKFNLPTVIFRFFQVFGEFQREDTALAAFLKAQKEGRAITLTTTTAQSTFKSGQRDFIYAGDLAEALIKAIKSGIVDSGIILNIASGKVYTMEEIANTIGAEVVWIPKREHEVERHEADMQRTFTYLNWQAKTDVIEWLKALS